MCRNLHKVSSLSSKYADVPSTTVAHKLKELGQTNSAPSWSSSNAASGARSLYLLPVKITCPIFTMGTLMAYSYVSPSLVQCVLGVVPDLIVPGGQSGPDLLDICLPLAQKPSHALLLELG